MADKEGVIQLRSIKLVVVVPAEHAWAFMQAFGETFAHKQARGGASHIRPVDAYYNHSDGWHIDVTVSPGEEAPFYQFFQEFCQTRGLHSRRARSV